MSYSITEKHFHFGAFTISCTYLLWYRLWSKVGVQYWDWKWKKPICSLNTLTYKVITCLFHSDSVSTNAQTLEMQSWQNAVHLTPVPLYNLCFAHLLLEDYSHGWAVKPPLQVAVLQQGDLEAKQGPVNFALSKFNLQLGKGLSMDLPSGSAWQTAGFLPPLSLWYRHRGWSLVFEDD